MKSYKNVLTIGLVGITLVTTAYAISWPSSPAGEPENGRVGSLIFPDVENSRVGIGTTNPTVKLEVSGVGTDYTNKQVHVNAYSTGIGWEDMPALGLTKSHSNTLGDIQPTVDGEILGQFGIAGVNSENLAYNSIAITAVQNGDAGTGPIPGNLLLQTADGTNPMTTRMTITSSGNVGIGTTDPEQLLHINSDDTVWTAMQVQNNDTGGKKYAIASTGSASAVGAGLLTFYEGDGVGHRMVIKDGNVGIGTTDPVGKLQINADADSNGINLRNAANNAIFQVYNTESAGAVAYVRQDDATIGVQLASDGSSYFNGGNVGIGTTDPEAKLEVGRTKRYLIVQKVNTDPGGNLCAIDTNSEEAESGKPPTEDIGYQCWDRAFKYDPAEWHKLEVVDKSWEANEFRTSDPGSVNYCAADVDPSELETTKTIPTEQEIGTECWDKKIPYWYKFIARRITERSFDIASNGNVNIGETSEIHNLNLEGSVGIESYSPMIYLKRNRDYGGFVQGVQTQLMDGTNNWWWGNLHEDHWMVSKGAYNNMKFVIKSNGNVGIGTTDPGAKLEISADTENQLRINGTRTDGDFSGIWLEGLWSNSNEAVFGIVGTNDHSSDILDDKFRFQIKDENGLWRRPIMFKSNGDVQFNAIGGSSGTMTIKEDGNVGIGTTDPVEKLVVDGNILLPGSTTALKLNTHGNYINATPAGFNFRMSDSGSGEGEDIRFVGTGGSEVMRIKNTGNVGIGTTDPGAKLHINTNDSVIAQFNRNSYDSAARYELTNGGIQLSVSDDAGSNWLEAMLVKEDGNVGIGTAYPGAKLEISADTENQLRINGTRTDGDFSGIWLEGLWSNSNEAVFGIVGTNDHSSDILDDKFRFQIKDENGLWRRPIMFKSNGDVQFNAIGGSSGTMTIKEDGNVGIGTTDPLSPFHVNIATNQNIRFRSESSEAEIMVANDVGTLTPLRMKASEFNFNNGNVGIGTTSPTQTLSISGAMNITPSASPPENPSAGTIYVDSSSAVCVYIGGGWTSIAGAGTCD